MTEHHLQVKRTARYYTIGELNEQTKQIWFVLHGYGQMAQYFIRKFEVLNDGQTLIVAPEALSRFYLNGVSGRVGATWMTKEDRQSEIDDYVLYLNELCETIVANDSKIVVNVLGFSQGTATALRWINNGKVRPKNLIIWAGYFGKGLGDVVEEGKLDEIKTHFVYGTKDEYLGQIDLNAYHADVLSIVPDAIITSFEGTHTIDEATLLKIVSDLTS